MNCHFEWNGLALKADLTNPLDLSTVLVGNGGANPSAWYVNAPRMEPVRSDGFVGAVAEGGAVNFRNVMFNPHGHGTHTECLGHITSVIHPVDPLFRNETAHFVCLATTVSPQARGEDLIIDANHLESMPDGTWPPALVIRTLPNGADKRTRSWSNTNPPYFTVDFMKLLVEKGVEHLLVDLPSVDREVDGGRLEAHRAFWGVPESPRHQCSITELIYMPSSAPDGMYVLHLAVAPMQNDAATSRPVLFPLVR